MSLTLAITDAADGTGGTATITDSVVTSSNSLYYAPWTGSMGQLSWTLAGSRTGDGTISLVSPSPIPLGYYAWRLDSLSAGVTNVAVNYQNITDATEDSLYYRILEAVQLRVQGLNLVGLNNTYVLKKWLPRFVKLVDPVPTIMICPANQESYPGLLTNKDDIGLAVLVAIIDKGKKDFTANLDRNLGWRWDVLSALRFQRLAGITEVLTCIPEPTSVMDEGMFDQEIFYSPLVFRFITRTLRG